MRPLLPALLTAAALAAAPADPALAQSQQPQPRRDFTALAVNPVGLAQRAVQAGFERGHASHAYGVTFGWFRDKGSREARYDYQSLDATYRWAPGGDPFRGAYAGVTAGAVNLTHRTDFFFGDRAEVVQGSSNLSAGLLAGYVLSRRGAPGPTLNVGGGVRYLHRLTQGADAWTESPRVLPILRLELGVKL